MKSLSIILMIGMSPFICSGQASKTTRKNNTAKAATKGKSKPVATPAAAFKGNQYVYFPDYYAFYDPNRGYIFWNKDTKAWTFSLQPPTFMSKVDMSKTRVQILKDLSLDLHPEQNYPNYMRLYPAQTTNPEVPVPDSRQTGVDGY